MFRMSFDSWHTKTVEEHVLSAFMCTHASCMHVQLVFMHTHLVFMRTCLCSLVHMDVCPSMHMHAGTLRMHTKALCTHVGTQKIQFSPNFYYFFHLFFLSNNDYYAHFLVFFICLTSFLW